MGVMYLIVLLTSIWVFFDALGVKVRCPRAIHRRLLSATICSLLALCPTAAEAQDLLKGLKDLQKTLESATKGGSPPLQRGQATSRANPGSSSAATQCLDDICLGDGIEVLAKREWVSLQDWNKSFATGAKQVRSSLAESLGKRKADKTLRGEQIASARASRSPNAEQMKYAFGGRVVADDATIESLAARLDSGELRQFDGELLTALSNVKAVCWDDLADIHRPLILGVLKKDSPNKTAVLIQFIPDAEEGVSRWTVTLLGRVFDSSRRNLPDLDSLQQSLFAQYPDLRIAKGPEGGSGIYFDRSGIISDHIQRAGWLISSDLDRNHDGFPAVVVMKNGFFGTGRVAAKWGITPRLPATCQRQLRTD